MVRGLGLGKEATYGEDVALTEFISIIDENFSLDNGIIADQEVGYRGKPKPVPGSFNPSGGFKFFAEPENCGLTLLGALLAVSTTDLTGGEFRHDFTPGTTPQYLTAGVIGDVVAGQRTYPGYAIKKLKISVIPGQKVMFEVDGFAKTINLDTLASPSFSTLDPFVAHQASVKIATVATSECKAITIEIENMFEEDAYTTGDRTRHKAPLNGLVVKGTMDLYFQSLDELENFLGAAAATSPEDTIVKQQIDIDIDSGVLIGAATDYQLNIEMKECVYLTEKANIIKRDHMIQNLAFEAFVPASGDQIKIELFNSVASY